MLLIMNCANMDDLGDIPRASAWTMEIGDFHERRWLKPCR